MIRERILMLLILCKKFGSAKLHRMYIKIHNRYFYEIFYTTVFILIKWLYIRVWNYLRGKSIVFHLWCILHKTCYIPETYKYVDVIN